MHRRQRHDQRLRSACNFNVNRHRHVLPQHRWRRGHVELHFDRARGRVHTGIDVADRRRKTQLRVGIGRDQRALAQGQQREVLLVDLHHHLSGAARRQRHQQFAGLHHVADLHIAGDQRAFERRDDHRVASSGARGLRGGAGARHVGHRQRAGAARNARAVELFLCGPHLRVGHLTRLARLVQCRLPDEAFVKQFLAAGLSRAGVAQAGFRLSQSLCCNRGLHLLKLTQACLCLDHGHVSLPARRAQLGGFEFDQHITGFDSLAFGNRNAQDLAGDLRANLYAVRRFDAAAGHNGLHQVAA